MNHLFWGSLLVVLALLGSQGCGDTRCKSACKKMSSCLGQPTRDGGTSASCSLPSKCGPRYACYADCIMDAPCEGINGLDSKARAALQSCEEQCNDLPVDEVDGGNTTTPAPPPDLGHNGERPRGEGLCVRKCTGKECGSDGCGGSCGSCTYPATCDSYGKCVGSATSFGGKCSDSTPCSGTMLCAFVTQGATSGFCTQSCATLGNACSGAPSGTQPFCLLTDQATSTNYCAFICAYKDPQTSQTYSFSCPSQLNCDTVDNPAGSGQRECIP